MMPKTLLSDTVKTLLRPRWLTKGQCDLLLKGHRENIYIFIDPL